MIIKKLHRKIIKHSWNMKCQDYEYSTIIDYVGWYLFGIIPLYRIELDRYEDTNFENCDNTKPITWGINRKFNSIMYK